MKFFKLLFLTMTLSCLANAGQEGSVGNGGDIVYCPNEGHFTLDYYEAIQNGKPPKYLGTSVAQKVQSSLARLAKRSPKLSEAIEYFALPLALDFDFLHNNRELSNFELNRNTKIAYFTEPAEITEIYDSNHRFVPSNCQVKQIANSYPPRNLLEKRYYVNAQLLKKLDQDNLASLALHESIYTIFKAYYRHENSVHVRGLNSLISSDELSYLPMYEYVKFLNIFQIVQVDRDSDQNVISPFNGGVDVLIGKHHMQLEGLTLTNESNFTGFAYFNSKFQFGDNFAVFSNNKGISVKDGMIAQATLKKLDNQVKNGEVTLSLASHAASYEYSYFIQSAVDTFWFNHFSLNSKQYEWTCRSSVSLKNNRFELPHNSASDCYGHVQVSNTKFAWKDAKITFHKDLSVATITSNFTGAYLKNELNALQFELYPNGKLKSMLVEQNGMCGTNFSHTLFNNKINIKGCYICNLKFDEEGQLSNKECKNNYKD